MKTQRRDMLKGLFTSAAGMAGVGVANKAEASTLEKEVGEVTMFQELPVFSAFTKIGNLVFISGVGCHEGENTIKNHTTVVMRDLKKAIEAAGSSMEKVLKCYAYIDDVANYAAMNKIYDKAWKKRENACTYLHDNGKRWNSRSFAG